MEKNEKNNVTDEQLKDVNGGWWIFWDQDHPEDDSPIKPNIHIKPIKK